MNKLVLVPFVLALLSPFVLGDMMGMMNMMQGTGMMGTGPAGFFGASLVWLVYFAIGSFVFGLTFWYAYKLIVPQNNKKR